MGITGSHLLLMHLDLQCRICPFVLNKKRTVTVWLSAALDSKVQDESRAWSPPQLCNPPVANLFIYQARQSLAWSQQGF